jgi:hypothetical protein
MEFTDARSTFPVDAFRRSRPWLDGRTLVGTLHDRPRFDPQRSCPVILADSLVWNVARSRMEARYIGTGHVESIRGARSDGVSFQIEIAPGITGDTIVDLLRLYGPGPGTVEAVVDQEGHLLALAVKPGGDRMRGPEIAH